MTETALLRAVARHPDEDTPRLAYADWLDENGVEARAEFVRAQVEYAATPADSPRRREVAFRARQLLDAHEAAWLAPFEALDRDLFWRRGFVETLETQPGDLDGEDGPLFDTTPFRRVFVRKLGGKADGLELIPRDNRVVALDLTANDLTANALKKLARFTHLPHVREVCLIANNLTHSAVNVLFGADFFQRLSLIRLAGNPFSQTARDRLRDHFGDRVSFAFERDPDRLYTIQDDYLTAGWGSDNTQVHQYGELHAIFDHAGTLLRTEEKKYDLTGVTGIPEQNRRRKEFRQQWLAELGWVSGTIKVKRFQFPHGEGLTAFNWWAADCERRNDAQRRGRVELVRRWIDGGQYRYAFGNDDALFARDGEVTDT